ncbi:LuxS/MPP-like metallohydrolase [Thozetella sp. PMI_491]|nr:LuxS/MPP-like metallohydrolase [Thozetella sp. PMI_491]
MESIGLVTDQLEAPLTDNRTYCVMRLPNGLEALVAHDPTAEEAGASLDVGVGSMSDTIPGIAHALEHLVLKGTKQYPSENDFNSYVKSHSGAKNASTSISHTNYYFAVAAMPSNGEEPSASNPSALLGGLDRLAHLGIDPLIEAETVDRELHAVDSEHKIYLQDDWWRFWQFERSTANPKHPWNHFNVGNLKVLKQDPESAGIQIQDSLREFYDSHYSANRMKLCVLGREPLPVLKDWVTQCFSGIPTRSLTGVIWPDELPLTKNQLGVQFFIKPISNRRQLILTWPYFYLEEKEFYESQPSRYITFLLSHKGPGGVLAYIKEKGWATNISSGTHSICSGQPGIFRCFVTLTPEGVRSYMEVVKTIFQYLAMLREIGPQKRIFDEAQQIAQLRFQYREKTSIRSFTRSVSARMRKSIPREWLLNTECLRKFDPEAITKGLDCLRGDNFRMFIVSPEDVGVSDSKEKWYGTEYRSAPIPETFIEELVRLRDNSTANRPTEFRLPNKNPFLPASLSINQEGIPLYEPSRPHLVRNDEKARIWWVGNSGGVPKAYLRVICRSPFLLGSAKNEAMASLLVDLIDDQLLENAFAAEQAGFSYTINHGPRGFTIHVNGYNDKLRELLELLVVTIRDFEVREDRFKIVKTDAIDTYRNKELRAPYRQVPDYTLHLVTDTDVLWEERAVELSSIGAEDIQHFKQVLLSQLHLEVLVHGNIDREEAKELTTMVESALDYKVFPVAEWPVRKSLILPPGSRYRFQKELSDPENANNCINYWTYLGDRADAVVRAKTKLLGQLIGAVAFDWLRTKLQLGYVVQAYAYPRYTTWGFDLVVQGQKSCQFMETCAIAFLKTYLKWLKKMSEEEFETQKRSVLTRVTEKPKNLKEAFQSYAGTINSEHYNFQWEQQDVANLGIITKADMVDFYEHFICPSSAQSASLVVHLKSRVKSSHEATSSSLTTPDGSTETDDIKRHLRHTLKVEEKEIEDGVELWREILSKSQKIEGGGSQHIEDDGVEDIVDISLFRAGLGTMELKRLDLSELED